MKILQITSNMRFFAPKMWPMLCFVSKNRNMSRHVGNLCVRMVLLLLPLHLYVAHNLSLSLSLALLTLLTEREGMCESQFTRVQISGQTKKGFQIPGNKEQQHLRANPPPSVRPYLYIESDTYTRHHFKIKGSYLDATSLSLSLSLSLSHCYPLYLSL